MAHVEPVSREPGSEFGEVFAGVQARLGFVPNSMLTMARRPEILHGFVALTRSTLGDGLVAPALKAMIAEVASTAAGCRYCQAHEAVHMRRSGVNRDKVAALWEYETSPLFTDAERAALDLARDAALVPSGATREHFAALRNHFSDEQIVEIVAVIATFGFLNRWNDTMATELEQLPLEIADEYLNGADWTPGKHVRRSPDGTARERKEMGGS